MDVNVLDYADLKAQGTAGSASGTTFTETGAFTGVAKGETLWIQTGANAGSYLIHARTDNSVTVEPSLSTESSLEWKVTSTLTLTHRAGSESHLVDSGTAIVSTSPWILLQTGGFTNIEDGMELQVEVDGVSYYYPIVAHDDDSVSVSEFMPTGSVERPWWARTMRGVLQPGLGYDVDTLYSPGSFTGVQVGDTLWLQSGPDMGTYTITHVGTDYVRVSGQDWTALNNVRWKITAWAPFDCTAAFQAAIDAASEEGGTVYVPSGYYHLAGSLDMKRNTVLTGMWNLPPQWSEEAWMEGVEQGPVLCTTHGMGGSADAFITLDGNAMNAGVEGLSIYYPLQGVVSDAATLEVSVALYPWSIRLKNEPGESSGLQRIRNVHLVNPYEGIHMNLEGDGVGQVSGLLGCPLSTGMMLERVQTAHVEKVAFHPENWTGSYVDGFSNDIRTQMAAHMRGFLTVDANHVSFKDISLWMASIGMYFPSIYPSVESPVVEATNIKIEMANKCIRASTGTLRFSNVRLHTTQTEGYERIVNSLGAYSSEAKCVEASDAVRMSFLGGDMATTRDGVDWSSEDSLNVSGVSIVNVVVNPATPNYGVHAEAGSVRIHGNMFPNDDTGFTEPVHVTSGVAKAIVYGNIYNTTSHGTNEAADRDFIVQGNVDQSGDFTANGNITAAGGNVTATHVIASGNVSSDFVISNGLVATNALVTGIFRTESDIEVEGNILAHGTVTAKAGASSGTFKAAGALFNVFGSATTSSSSETGLLSDSLPANSLVATGDKIRIFAGGTFTNGDSVSGKWEFFLKLGSTVVFAGAVHSTGVAYVLSSWRLAVDIWKNGSNAVISGQLVTDGHQGNSLYEVSQAVADYASLAVAFTSAHTIQVFGKVTTTASSSITQNVLSAEIYPAP